MRDKNKRRKIMIVGYSIVGLIVIAALVWAASHFAPTPADSTKQFLYRVQDGTTIVVNTTAAEKVSIRYGHYDEIASDNEADQWQKAGPDVSFLCKYNGEYTITVLFTDGTRETRYISVTGNEEPIRLISSGDKIDVFLKDGYRVESISYCYGLKLGDPYANYLPLDKDVQKVQALGNGWHTFRSFVTSSKSTDVYYMTVLVDGCEKPIVFFMNGAVGIFSYGFDVKNVIYARGTFDTWQALSDSPDKLEVMTNCTLDISDFISGETYTFGFRTGDKDYFVTVQIP